MGRLLPAAFGPPGSATGASFSLPYHPAKVPSLNAERLLSLGGGNRPSCLIPVIERAPSGERIAAIAQAFGAPPSITRKALGHLPAARCRPVPAG
jgi:hypothetical protein